MIKQKIYLEKYDWDVLVFYGMQKADVDEVCDSLVQIGCTGSAVDSARVVSVSRTTSEYEFVNTVTHEMFHIVSHVCDSLGIDMKSEEPCYLMGWLCQAVSRIFI